MWHYIFLRNFEVAFEFHAYRFVQQDKWKEVLKSNWFWALVTIQSEVKGGSFPQFALDIVATAMKIEDVFNYRQS